LASVALQLAIVAGGALTIALGGVLAMVMPERRRYGAVHADTSSAPGSAAFWNTFRAAITLIRQRPILGSLLGVSLGVGAASEGVDRLWAKVRIATGAC
jgi:O-antigen ligase